MVNYLGSLKQCVITSRVGKAKNLLKELKKKSEDEKQGVLHILALAPDKIALELLEFLSDEKNRDPGIFPRVIQLVTDRAHLNFKFALILFKNAGRTKLQQAVPLIRHILSKETDSEILTQAVRTIAQEKLEDLIDEVVEFIFYDDDFMKAEAIDALEMLGSPLALSKLQQAAQTDKCDENILDAIESLKRELKKKAEAPAAAQVQPAAPATPAVEKKVIAGPDDLVKQLTSKNVIKRFDAFIKLSELGSKVSTDLAKQLKTKDHDLIINILRLVSRTIPRNAVTDIFSIMNGGKSASSLKFAAYLALASFPELESAASIVKGLSESASYVRLAAVKVLDKNLTDFVCAEIKDRIESGTKSGEQLAQIILIAQANNIIEYLTISDTFQYITSNYLTKSSPVTALENYITILEKRNLKSTAKKYKDILEEKTDTSDGVFIVISSSDAIIKTYEKIIYSAGFSTLGFQGSQEAFEAIVSQKPLAIICDLFLNDMTAFDFAKEARQFYPKQEVPFIISALQKNLDKDLLQKEMDAADINYMYDFPFKVSQVKTWLN